MPTFSDRTRSLCVFAALYFLASLLHFAHNAEYIAFYPNMPAWITRENVYLTWLAITGVGMAAAALWWMGRRIAAALALALYGLFGLDGLAHYALALCAEHRLAANLSIWLEAASGVALAAAALWQLRRLGAMRPHAAMR
jgi:hypothetical protein